MTRVSCTDRNTVVQVPSNLVLSFLELKLWALNIPKGQGYWLVPYRLII